MEKAYIKTLVDNNLIGFNEDEKKKVYKTLNKYTDQLNGITSSFQSGGNHCHTFFQLKDFTWIGFHNANVDDATLSKPFKTSKSLYTAFWDNEGVKVFGSLKPEKISHAEYLNASKVLIQWCKEKNKDISFLYPRGK
jgi:hypothetical protein